jgi:TRAP-type C4-dicarboxylate transport system permease small subunit
MHTGLYWSEEVCTGCFVWAVFLGSAACYKRQLHLGVDVIVKRLPAAVQKIVTIIVDIILIVLNGYITYESYVYVTLSYTKPTAVLGVSSAYISTSIVISFACMTVFSVYFLIQDLRGRREEA